MKKILAFLCAVLLLLPRCAGSSAVTEAAYPGMRAYTDQMDSGSIEYKLWREEREKLRAVQYDGYEEGMETFVRKTAAAVLGDAENDIPMTGCGRSILIGKNFRLKKYFNAEANDFI